MILKKYEYFLKRFFESSILENNWNKRRLYTSGFLDERFETLFYLDESNRNLNKMVRILISKTEKIEENTYKNYFGGKYKLVHIANKSYKSKTYKTLVERGYINDRLT